MWPAISDYNKRLTLLSVIQLSGGHCVRNLHVFDTFLCFCKGRFELTAFKFLSQRTVHTYLIDRLPFLLGSLSVLKNVTRLAC